MPADPLRSLPNIKAAFVEPMECLAVAVKSGGAVVYEPGKRSGAWIKHRVNLGQEFVIGGFTPGPHGLDAIIVGYYRDD